MRLTHAATSRRWSFKLIPVDRDKAPKIPAEVDALYLFPLRASLGAERLKGLLQDFTSRGYPTFSMMGRPAVEAGAAAGQSPVTNQRQILRRIAVDVFKIMQGRRAETLPVEIAAFRPDLIVNVATLRQLERYPDWNSLARALQVGPPPPRDDVGGRPPAHRAQFWLPALRPER